MGIIQPQPIPVLRLLSHKWQHGTGYFFSLKEEDLFSLTVFVSDGQKKNTTWFWEEGRLEIRCKKIGSFSLIERVILSAGAMLIFSVSFQID
jgi:hypothetical protein